jgi:DNA-binding XRE family transcriptional regulator
MTQKMAKKDGYTRATLADIEREMAKPRLAESVREAVELAEEEARAPLASGPRGKHKD